MELKEYQVKALEAFSRWLDALESTRTDLEKAADALRVVGADVPGDVRNYPKAAWERLKQSGGVAESAGEYTSRTDYAGRPIPHICFKVPTGGGKTLLAAKALERLGRHTGLTLWITPTRAIYAQTKAALRNREHPYRQTLERASGGRVKLLEKDDLFTRADTVNYLCVMLLMLPAANRQKGKEFLRMFRDSGRYPTFFPDSDDALGDGELLRRYPDLERASDDGPVKHSLYNVFKMLRPVVILDEAHKAYGMKRETSEDFVDSVNPARPQPRHRTLGHPKQGGVSNLLVDITGVELKQEEMIKLPVHVESLTNADWQHTLAAAHDKLEDLAAEAQSLEASQGQYIRPIAVVRVERTGKDQRDGERVHAEDVRQYLTQNLVVPAEAVAVKSSPDGRTARRRSPLTILSRAMGNHQIRSHGGLGLSIRLYAGDAGQHPRANRPHPACRPRDTTARRSAHRTRSSRPMLRLLLEYRHRQSRSAGQGGFGTGGADQNRRRRVGGSFRVKKSHRAAPRGVSWQGHLLAQGSPPRRIRLARTGLSAPYPPRYPLGAHRCL